MMAECTVSLGVILLLSSFGRTVVLGFPLGLQPTQPQVLDYLSSDRHKFHLMGRALNPIREWLVATTPFVSLSHS